MNKLQVIHKAYNDGTNGESLPDVQKTSRLVRVAHNLGRRSYNKAIEQNNRLDDEMNASFNEAFEKAQGLNKNILAILEQAAKIPREHSSKPLWGVTMNHGDGTRTQDRLLTLSFGKSVNPDFDTPVTNSLGAIHIDSSQWADNGLRTPVNTISFISRASLDGNGAVEAVTSGITINQPIYDPDNIVFDEGGFFTGGSKLTIDADGGIGEVGTTRSDQTGFTIEDAQHIRTNTPELLVAVLASVEATAKAYQSIDEITDPI
jgi:hypothetical protein